MITAEHIIGLSAMELGRCVYGDKDAIKTIIRQRFETIHQEGQLKPRGNFLRELDSQGSQRNFDLLAGDGKYIFLSAGSRYRQVRESDICYGFIFDAKDLIEAGAIVGPDLLADYEALADEITIEVEATLPAKQPVSDEDLKEFAEKMGISDPGMLDFIRTDSTRRHHDIFSAMEDGDLSVPGAEQALMLWRERLPAILAKRKSGVEALEMLKEGKGKGDLEILVEGPLDLQLSIGLIVGGQLKL